MCRKSVTLVTSVDAEVGQADFRKLQVPHSTLKVSQTNFQLRSVGLKFLRKMLSKRPSAH